MSPFFAYAAIAFFINHTVFGSVHHKATINKRVALHVHCSSIWAQSIIQCSSHCAEDAYCVTLFSTISHKCDVCLGSCAVPTPMQVPPGKLIVSPFRDWSRGMLISVIFTDDKICNYFHFLDYVTFAPPCFKNDTHFARSFVCFNHYFTASIFILYIYQCTHHFTAGIDRRHSWCLYTYPRRVFPVLDPQSPHHPRKWTSPAS